MDLDDDRPTLPLSSRSTVRIASALAFDTETELFLSNAPTLPEIPVTPLAAPSQRALRGWVASAVAVCFAVLACAYVTSVPGSHTRAAAVAAPR